MSEEKWAVITGASQGIGRAMAAEAARRGLNLLLIALPDTGLPAVADELSCLYDVESEFWEIDLAGNTAIAEFVEYVRVSRRTVELLINNAGIGGTAPFAGQNPERLASMIDVNVGALTVLTRLLLPHLVGQGEAHILNVASLAGWYPTPGMSVYAATKASVISLSLALRDELENTGVSVSVLCPSGVVRRLHCKGSGDGGRVGIPISSRATPFIEPTGSAASSSRVSSIECFGSRAGSRRFGSSRSSLAVEYR